MEIDVSDLLVRYLERACRDSPQYRAVLTAAILRDHDSRIGEVLKTGGQLDIGLVTEFAELASPIELATLLANWGDFLPPRSFLQFFGRIYENSSDSRTLCELALAAAHYHDTHPGAIDIPAAFAHRLLVSPDEDARLVGLKILRRFLPDGEDFVARALAALETGTSTERCGATHEILVLVDDSAHRFLSSLSRDTVLELGEKLKAASQNDVDLCTRENAANAHRLLCDFIGNGG